jgi:NTP pyrophosphatase (non-canonical NTP hydrolase)
VVGDTESGAKRMSTSLNRMDLAKRATKLYGEGVQLDKVVEECLELAHAVFKYKQGRGSAKEVLEEMADVSLMLTGLEYIFQMKDYTIPSRYSVAIDFKMEKLNKQLTEDEKVKPKGNTPEELEAGLQILEDIVRRQDKVLSEKEELLNALRRKSAMYEAELNYLRAPKGIEKDWDNSFDEAWNDYDSKMKAKDSGWKTATKDVNAKADTGEWVIVKGCPVEVHKKTKAERIDLRVLCEKMADQYPGKVFILEETLLEATKVGLTEKGLLALRNKLVKEIEARQADIKILDYMIDKGKRK